MIPKIESETASRTNKKELSPNSVQEIFALLVTLVVKALRSIRSPTPRSVITSSNPVLLVEVPVSLGLKTNVSLPSPPVKTSTPAPPSITSSPAPPIKVSLPVPPMRWSAPPPPETFNTRARPLPSTKTVATPIAEASTVKLDPNALLNASLAAAPRLI